MTKWGPWYFIDDSASVLGPADLTKNAALQEQFRLEVNAAFQVYLFARRQDQDEFAFFHVTGDGRVEDSVIRAHLSFSKRRDHFTPAQSVVHVKTMDLFQWLREVTITDLEDWLRHDEEDPD